MDIYDYIKVYDFNIEDNILSEIKNANWINSIENVAHALDGKYSFYELNDYKDDIYGNLWGPLLTGQMQIINEYLKSHPKLELSGGTTFVFKKYKDGDCTYDTTGWNPGEPTTLRVIMSLTEYEGGEVLFNNDYKVKLGKNQVLVFPSAFMYRYEQLPVTSGIKYTVESGIV